MTTVGALGAVLLTVLVVWVCRRIVIDASQTVIEAKRALMHEPVTGQVHCGRCGQPIYFVAGLVGPSRWRHVDTQQVDCDPHCRHCGAPARHRVGRSSVDGGGFPTFVLSYWECDRCAQRELRIEQV